jgi:hypothetical protein
MADAPIADPAASIADPKPCMGELEFANTCIAADPETCTCFNQPFSTIFPVEFEEAFKQTLAFYAPDSSEFCTESNTNVCE